MAIANCTLAEPEHQSPRPEHERLAIQMDRCLMVMNVAEHLPILSASIMEEMEREAPERLVRQIKVLHHQLQSLAALAASAKVVQLQEP